MSDARNVYPRLCWGCLGVIEDYTHDHALLNHGGYCTDCYMAADGEMPLLRDALRGQSERMNDVSEREELLREVSAFDKRSERDTMSEYEDFTPNTTGNTNCGIPMPSGWHTITVRATAAPPAAGMYVGDVPWQYAPPPPAPPWYGQPQVPVMVTTGTSTAQQVWPFSNVDELREFVKAIVRETLEEDAREIATNKAFQAVYVPASGVCWACGKPSQDGDFRWFTRGGHSHLVHDSEECMRLASEKPDQREHRG